MLPISYQTTAPPADDGLASSDLKAKVLRLIDVTAKVFDAVLLKKIQSERDHCKPLTLVALGLGEVAPVKCITCVTHYSNVGASSELWGLTS